MSTTRKIATNLFFLGSSQGLSWFFASISILILPRYIHAEGVGTLGLVGTISSIILLVAGLGTKTFLLREVARYPDVAGKLAGAAIVLNVGLALICWAVVLVLLNLIHADPTLKGVAYVVSVTCMLGILIIPLQSAMAGMDKMHFTIFDVLLGKALGTTIAVTLALLKFELVYIAMADTICMIPVVIFYFYWFHKYSHVTFSRDPAVYRQLIIGGWAFLVNDVVFNIYFYLDGLMLATMTSLEVVGYYNVPTRLFGTLLSVPIIFSRAILPSMSRIAHESKETLNELARKTLTFFLCISLPIAVGNGIIAEPFVNFFYGKEFAPSIPIMIILGFSVVPTYLGIGLSQVLIAQDRQGEWSKFMILACVVNLVLNALLITYFQAQTGNGGVGAALALLTTEMVIGVCACATVGRAIFNQRLLLDILRSLGAVAVMGVVIWPLRDLFLPIPVVVGGLVYALGVVGFGLIPFVYVKMVLWSARKWGQARLGLH